MRALAAVLAVTAALALAGCSSQPDSPVDPETVDEDDYEGPLVILGILLIVGVVLLAINLSNTNRGPPPHATPPTPPLQPPSKAPTWETVEEDEGLADDGSDDVEETPVRKPVRSAAKPARRRAP